MAWVKYYHFETYLLLGLKKINCISNNSLLRSKSISDDQICLISWSREKKSKFHARSHLSSGRHFLSSKEGVFHIQCFQYLLGWKSQLVTFPPKMEIFTLYWSLLRLENPQWGKTSKLETLFHTHSDKNMEIDAME